MRFKKSWKYILVIAFVLVVLFAYELKCYNGTNDFNIYEKDDIELTVKKIENRVLGFTLSNHTQEVVTYGAVNYVQQRTFLSWKTLPDETFYFLMAYELQPGAEAKYELPLDIIYGELPRGRYRIIKSVEMNGEELYVSEEFTLQ